MLVQAIGVVNVWLPGRCRWLGIFWCKTICSFYYDVVLSPLHPLTVMLYWAGYSEGCECWPVRCRWLGTFWCKAICSSEFDVVQAIYSHCYECCLVRSVRVVGVWQPEWFRWLGIFWCKAMCNSEFDVVQAIYSLWQLNALLWSGLLRCVTVWWPGWCRWLGICISDTRPSAGLSLMWCQVIYRLSLFNMLQIGPVCKGLWVFGSLVSADGLAYLMQGHLQLCGFIVVPSNLHPLVEL